MESMNRHAHAYTPLVPAPIFSIPHTKAKISIRADTSTRRRHIRLLNDILHLSIQRRQWDKARRAWAVLARCSEVDWRAMWHIGLLLIGKQTRPAGVEGNGHEEGTSSSVMVAQDRVDYLKTLMLRYPLRRESLLRELSLELIFQERYTEALDELELYLPIFPYHDNPVLHLYAGLICLYLAQKPSSDDIVSKAMSTAAEPGRYSRSVRTNKRKRAEMTRFSFSNYYGEAPLSSLDVSGFSPGYARSAQRYFDRAKTIDPQNPTAKTFLALLENTFSQAGGARSREMEEDELDNDDPVGAHFQPHQLGAPAHGLVTGGRINIDDEAEMERSARAKKMRGAQQRFR
ncbi:hypothetical protein FRB96_009495 [Tulasnella sp. 330]|nr:hypothetical protein FRB96_009495 [Tulasnella sp. 330]